MATRVLRLWIDDPVRILGTTADAVATVLRRAVELDLGGNVHDALIARVCVQHGTPLITLDRRRRTWPSPSVPTAPTCSHRPPAFSRPCVLTTLRSTASQPVRRVCGSGADVDQDLPP